MDELGGVDGSGEDTEATDSTGSARDQPADHAGTQDADSTGGAETAEGRSETLTRDEYADQTRRGPAVEVGEVPGRDSGERGEPEPAVLAQASASAGAGGELAEPRTREEVASEARADTEPAAGSQKPGTAPAGNTTDQQTARQPGDRTPELEHDSVPADQAQASGQATASADEAPSGPGQGPAQDIGTAELAPAEHAARQLAESPHNQPDQAPRRDKQPDETGTDKPATIEQPVLPGEQSDQQGQEQADGHREPKWWLTVAAADRTLSDTTPTGIGRKPTGEELLHDRGDRTDSRLDRFLDSAFEHADDVRDGTDQIDKAIASDIRPGGGPSGHLAPHQSHAGYERPQLAYYQRAPPDSPGISDAFGSIVIVGIAAAVALRRAWKHHRREHE